MNHIQKIFKYFSVYRDRAWLLTWFMGIALLFVWNILYLNQPARIKIAGAFANTVSITIFAVIFAVIEAWMFIQFTYLLNRRWIRPTISFVLNLIRSVPQIIGLLFGYVILTKLATLGLISGLLSTILSMSLIISIFIFLEIYDLLCERIEFFRRREFYHAMVVCGISEFHIINKEIILRSSFVHVLNKIISLSGISVFLICSIDFILSVGLSTQVSSVNLPTTLGSLLAQIDSKQDILAIGHTLTNWSYISKLPFEHLQGISVAFIIVFTLLCSQRIANSYTRRNRL